MNRYLVIDGMLNGTGIRDYYEGGYINPADLNLSPGLLQLINEWLLKYWDASYLNYNDMSLVDALDAEGERIARLVEGELGGKVWYYSDATQQKKML
ncbi:MAG: hypothetical protein JST68_04400 [Bacteroidetes bacterium]|nr:hypothetical protein [Bacteroidota bacterium]